jgi:1,4-dihydroxy-6-naphthoate synthase
MKYPVRLCISTCPNDTFAFHGLMHRLVDWRGLEFQLELLDIQQLNERLLENTIDVAKGSFYAALRVADQIVVLPSGAALGFGVGPLLLAAKAGTIPHNATQLTLCPGESTTAHLLFQLYHANTTRTAQVVFSDIMPSLKNGQADFGVCIHEGRFTWQSEGLSLVEDLGTRWEADTQCPLPLGGIFASRRLPPDIISKVQGVLMDSLQLARANPKVALPTMRHYAQSFDDNVLMQHVELYVNQWTIDLGDVGRSALNKLSERAATIGLLPSSTARLEVFG